MFHEATKFSGVGDCERKPSEWHLEPPPRFQIKIFRFYQFYILDYNKIVPLLKRKKDRKPLMYETGAINPPK